MPSLRDEWPSPEGLFKSLKDALPVATMLVVGASVFYACGYFSYAGLEWLSELTLQDLFSLTWTGMPAALFAVVMGIIMPSPAPDSWMKIDDDAIHPPQPRWLYILLYAAAPPTLMASVGAIIVVPSTLRVEAAWGCIAVCVPIITASLLLTLSFHYPELGRRRVRKILNVVTLCLTLYCVAVIVGTIPFRSHNDLLRFKNGTTACVGAVYLGERAIIANVGGKTTSLFKWEQVESVSRHTGCGEPAKRP